MKSEPSRLVPALLAVFALAGCQEDESGGPQAPADAAPAPANELQSAAKTPDEEVPAEQRVIDFLWGMGLGSLQNQPNWGIVARRLSDEYLAACGGSPNEMAKIIIRDLGAQPTEYATQVTSLESKRAQVDADVRLTDDTTALMEFEVVERPDGWRIDSIRIRHREESWVMCRETPGFAGASQETGDSDQSRE